MNKNKHYERKEKNHTDCQHFTKKKKGGCLHCLHFFLYRKRMCQNFTKKNKGECLDCLHFFLYRKKMIVCFFVQFFFVFSKS